ncbi:DUF2357 domain-containing protein [Winogradskyella eckloniae]|uniref:DUF2357 domain-containing protein n=1 Tax=Winogradskyella eckloniae TaxID=1089306 RepID=UPI0015669377|nr:DUF2357 domain-containing protein [Winogradskyella eckloniae]NRD18940.1 DUF2357 domain-containing protein [Winogradskyella eckloniae]
MKISKNSISIEFQKDLYLKLFPIGNDAKIFEIDSAEAEEFGEAPFQILESRRYEYEFTSNKYQLYKTKECIPSANSSANRGIIAPGNFVGTLELNIKGPDGDIKCYLEVLATKFDATDDYDKSYRENYRSMVEDITEKCTELLMQSNSPVNQYFEPDFTKGNKTIYQKFSFVKSVINKDEFEESLLKIFSAPKTNWINKEERVDIRSLKKITNKNVQEILRGSNRIPLPKHHNLHKVSKLESIPSKINSYKQEPSLDNPENRFIKHSLQEYLQFCENCSSAFLDGSKDQKEAKYLIKKLETFLNHSFFKSISRPTSLKLNSPTLQRKGGYRQLLKSWLMFDLASKLTWSGAAEDVYEAGKRDIATLYEYWLFFVLYDLFKTKFDLTELTHNDEPYNHLFKPSKNGLNLIIKSGHHTALKGHKLIKNRNLSFKFSFNRTFSGHKDSFPKAGSWTTSMRPDYTLSVWPKELSETKAEIEEQILHIHFDAKYKVNQFKIDSNNTKTDLNEEGVDKQRKKLDKIKKQERKGIYKNADVLKMHAYKDAIRRTGGAYILYPGTKNKKYKGFHELIPGLGAFSVNPENESENISDLSNFIDEVIDHLVNRASQRENMAHKSYTIHKNDKPNEVLEPIPEYFNNEKLIPYDTYVLVGYCKSEEHLNWINTRLLYNFRMDSNRGALKLNKETLNAKYLLLHMEGEQSSTKLYRIIKPEYRVTNKATLTRLNYPNPRQKNYLVISIEKSNATEFKNLKWNFKDLDNYKKGRASSLPFAVSLPQFLEVKELIEK